MQRKNAAQENDTVSKQEGWPSQSPLTAGNSRFMPTVGEHQPTSPNQQPQRTATRQRGRFQPTVGRRPTSAQESELRSTGSFETSALPGAPPGGMTALLPDQRELLRQKQTQEIRQLKKKFTTTQSVRQKTPPSLDAFLAALSQEDLDAVAKLAVEAEEAKASSPASETRSPRTTQRSPNKKQRASRQTGQYELQEARQTGRYELQETTRKPGSREIIQEPEAEENPIPAVVVRWYHYTGVGIRSLSRQTWLLLLLMFVCFFFWFNTSENARVLGQSPEGWLFSRMFPNVHQSEMKRKRPGKQKQISPKKKAERKTF